MPPDATRQAVIFGAGNIGRGFIGQLFSEAGYFVTFVDVDRPLLTALNARGDYKIRLVTNERTAEVVVAPVRGLHAADTEAVAEAVAQAEIAATAVGAGALQYVAPNVARGLARRAERGSEQGHALNIIVCENLKGAAHIFGEMVRQEVSPGDWETLASRVGFVDTVIARMVPAPTPEMRAEDPSLIAVEPYKELPVDRTGFVGPIPAISGMIPFAPFSFYTERKLYIHNAGHALLAYLGFRGGYEYGYQALADDEIYFQVRGAMEESALALVRKYAPPPGALLANIEDLLARFANGALGDTVLRLARDPVRKLAHSDRLVGGALNALAQGVQPVNLVTGIAAALTFDSAADPVARDLQARLTRTGLKQVLAEVCGLMPDDPLAALVAARHAALTDVRSAAHRAVG